MCVFFVDWSSHHPEEVSFSNPQLNDKITLSVSFLSVYLWLVTCLIPSLTFVGCITLCLHCYISIQDRWQLSNRIYPDHLVCMIEYLFTAGFRFHPYSPIKKQSHYTPAQRSWWGGGYTGFTLSICLSVCLSVRPSVGDMVSGAKLEFALEFQFQISYACYLWLWPEAYWFSAMSLSKWPPGGHIGFLGFRTLTLVWLWISSPNFTGTSPVCLGRSLLIFNNVTFKMAVWQPYCFFFVSELCSWHGFRIITRVCFGISISNFICMLFVAMHQSLFSFRNVAFKMAEWQPYLIFFLFSWV